MSQAFPYPNRILCNTISDVSDLSSIDLDSEVHSSSQFESFPKVDSSPPHLTILSPERVSHLSLVARGILLGGTGWLCFIREQHRLLSTPLWYWSFSLTVLYSILVCNGILTHWFVACYPYWYRYLEGFFISASGAIVLYLTYRTQTPEWHNLLFLWALINVGAHFSYTVFQLIQRWLGLRKLLSKDICLSTPNQPYCRNNGDSGDSGDSEKSLTPV